MNKNKKLNNKLIAGGIITVLVALISVIGMFYTPYDPNMMDRTAKFAGMSSAHILGCDDFGRDILSRIMQGMGSTFLIAFLTVLIGSVGGMVIGAFTGYYGGMLDEILMRLNDSVLAFPGILLALVFVSLMGNGRMKLILALGILFIPSFARIVRSEFIKYRNMDYIYSAKLMGAGDLRIMFIHILPNTYKVLLSAIAIGFNNAVLAEAGMSFLGLGVQPPDSSLGRMLADSQAFLLIKPSQAFISGFMIVLMILGFSMLSEGLEDA